MQEKLLGRHYSRRLASTAAAEQKPADPNEKLLRVTCTRCHKLTHEGRVASVSAEEELPAFDLKDAVGAKLRQRAARRAVLLVVVDIADFDGSLPRCARGPDCAFSFHVLEG